MLLRKKENIFLIIFIIVLFFGFFYFNLKSNNMDLGFKNVCINNNCFEVEIAREPEQRKQGLMFREELLEGRGMLFVFEVEGLYSFWMKNMKFPIDIIWIDKDKRIVGIEENVQPCLENICQGIKAKEKIMYVLEINSGLAKKMKIKPGDKVIF